MKISTGFSLIEMAIVLLIISLLIGGLLTPLSAQMLQQQIKLTHATLEEIKESLLGFAVINQRLPCPDSDGDGVEDTPCDGSEGSLPWINLNVGKEDAWGRAFRYRVVTDYTTTINSLSIESTLRIKDITGNFLTTQTTDSGVAIIVFSYGKDGIPFGENDGSNLTYVEDAYVDNRFDDIMMRISSNTLFNRLVTAGYYW